MKGLAAAVVLASVIAIPALPSPARAFCGFYVSDGDKPLYNDATMVALMRDGTRTVMSMSNNYRGPAKDFAMVVPVPVVLQKENVKTLDKDVFKHLEALSAPRLVEYWEQDPCPPQMYWNNADAAKGAPPAKVVVTSSAITIPNYGVTVEAKFAVGEYEIVVLSANQSDGLEAWLKDNKYNIPAGAAAALAPYIKEQQKFFVAKVNVKKVQLDAQGVAVLSPLRFSFESQDFRLPVRLGLINAKSKQDLIVYLLSKSVRYDVANYPNVFIPTNLEVEDGAKKSFSSFYATLFDEAVSKAGGNGVVTEYSWTSSSCDPCPTPPLSTSDLATLGGDVLFGWGAPAPTPTPNSPPVKTPPPMMPYYGSVQPMVLTRLHARYDAATLKEDLVFRAAEAVVGGREFVVDANGALEKGATSSTTNNFQARYIIRHPWTGPIACANPRRGVWGGPPSGIAGSTSPMGAQNLAAAPRGNIELANMLKAGMPDFQIVAGSPQSGGAATDGDAGTPDDAGASPATVPSVAPDHHGGCNCSTPGNAGNGNLAAAGVAASIIAIGRSVTRRRRREK